MLTDQNSCLKIVAKKVSEDQIKEPGSNSGGRINEAQGFSKQFQMVSNFKSISSVLNNVDDKDIKDSQEDAIVSEFRAQDAEKDIIKTPEKGCKDQKIKDYYSNPDNKKLSILEEANDQDIAHAGTMFNPKKHEFYDYQSGKKDHSIGIGENSPMNF